MFSCKSVKEIQTASFQNKWALKFLNGENAKTLFPRKVPTLEFNITEKRISGNGGCNGYGGNYTLTGNKFTASNIISTMMACFDAPKESDYLQILSKTSELSVKGEELIFTQNGKAVLVFEKAKPLSVKDLEGEWVLQSIQGATSNVHYKNKIPTIAFNTESMRVSGNASCNSYNGGFELSNDKLTITRLITTRKACVDGMEGEQKFLELLSGSADIVLENNMLTLKRDGLHLLSFTRE